MLINFITISPLNLRQLYFLHYSPIDIPGYTISPIYKVLPTLLITSDFNILNITIMKPSKLSAPFDLERLL